jgi:hypothetical protein
LANGEANSEKGIQFINAICALGKYIEILSKIKVKRGESVATKGLV